MSNPSRLLSGPAFGRSAERGGFSDLGNALVTCESVDELRALSPLPIDAQRLIDKKVIEVGMDRLVIARDIIEAGLTFPLSDPLGTMFVYQERIGRAGSARRMMLPNARGENQNVARDGVYTPVYFTVDDFDMNIRTLRASMRAGAPLDTTNAANAIRNVNESIEDATIYGAGFNVDGFTAYGLLTAPSASSVAYVGNEAWDAVGHTGEEILTDIMAMVDKMQLNRMWGPYNLYIPTTYGNKLNADFKTNGDKSILTRINELSYGDRPIRIRVADQLPANRTALVQMTDNVVDMIAGQEPTILSWESPNGMHRFFLAIACMIPRFKDTIEGQSGVVLGYPT